jgi:hypothetical protein
MPGPEMITLFEGSVIKFDQLFGLFGQFDYVC